MASNTKVTKAKRAIRDDRHKKNRIKKVRSLLGKLTRENGLLVNPNPQN